METASLKKLLDACFRAKHIVETLPELPKGMKPRHIHVLDSIDLVCREKKECRVSDVSEKLNITMPSVTKLIQELESLKMLEKYPDSEDKRVALLALTPDGKACVKKHVHDFHQAWAENLSLVPDDQVANAIALIDQLAQAMPGRQ